MVSRSRIGLLCAIVVSVTAFFAATGSAFAAGTIEGEVVDSVSEAPIEEVEVCAYGSASESCAETDAAGEYALTGLPDGSYTVEFWAPFLGYVTQFFDGKALPEDADEVTIVAGGTVSEVDAEMERGGAIEGRVTDAVSGTGIEEVEVCAYSLTRLGRCTLTGSTGSYALEPLGSGSYFIEFWAEQLGYETRFYSEQSNPGSANPVNVAAPGATTGIDARLSKPGSGAITHPSTPLALPPIVIPKIHPKPKALTCRKGFKKVKRHGRKVCVKKHKKKKKHRS